MANDDTIVRLDAEIEGYRRKLDSAGKLTDQLTAKVAELDKALKRAQGTSEKPIGPKSTGAGGFAGAVSGAMPIANLAAGNTGLMASLPQLAKIGGAVTGVVALAAGIAKIGSVSFEAARQTENLTAQLKALTGSSELAETTLAKLQGIAANMATPIDEVANTFVRLKRGGFDPTAEAMMSFGNIAAGSGKTLSSFMEAITDAKMGEFERLKEFMIDGSKAGDKFRFTFNGVTTEVDKNAAAMQKYFESLGNTAFKGALEEQAKTIDGVFARLTVSSTRYFNAIAEGSGIVDVFKRAMLGLSDAMMEASATDPLEIAKNNLKALNSQMTEHTKAIADAANETQKQYYTNLLVSAMNARAEIEKNIAQLESENALREGIDRFNTESSAKKAAADKKALDAAADQQKALEDMQKQAKGVVEDLKKELATRVDITKEIGIAYDLESGRFKDLQGPLRDEIEQLVKKKNALADINEQREYYNDLRQQEADASRERDKIQEEEDSVNNERLKKEADDANERIKLRKEQDEKEKNRVSTMFDFAHASEQERVDLAENAESTITAFRKMSMASQANIITGGFAKMTEGLAAHSKAFFKINKVAGIANAIVNTAQGVTEALKLPYPANLVAAASVAAAGAAQIMTIKSAQFGSGGNVNSPTGGGAQQQQPQAPSVFSGLGNDKQVIPRLTVAVRDDELLSGEGFRKLIRRIDQEARDMGITAYTLAV